MLCGACEQVCLRSGGTWNGADLEEDHCAVEERQAQGHRQDRHLRLASSIRWPGRFAGLRYHPLVGFKTPSRRVQNQHTMRCSPTQGRRLSLRGACVPARGKAEQTCGWLLIMNAYVLRCHVSLLL